MEVNKIYNINCQEAKIPNDALIISDPPYNIGYNYLGHYIDKVEDGCYMSLFEKFKGMRAVFIHYPENTIESIVPIMGAPNKVVSWVYNSNTAREHRMISWYNCKPDFSKVKQPYKNLNDKRILKRIAEGSKGTNLYDWWEIDLVKNVSEQKTEYTNQIPEEVISRIIQTTALENDLIIDPFNGSGTTCAVAEKLGYKWIGLDVSKEATRIAKNRLKDLQTNLFNNNC